RMPGEGQVPLRVGRPVLRREDAARPQVPQGGQGAVARLFVRPLRILPYRESEALMGAYQDMQDGYIAGAMRSTEFVREVAKSLVVYRRNNAEPVHSIYELLGILQDDMHD